MKAFVRWTLCLGLCLALLVCGALADEAPGITVQLDGQPLTFTDAVPQVKDQRTFLPFRAVFEAMGAQVDYEGSVITAARGDRSLTMTLDQTTATVTEKGVTTPITMDVAPYVDPATWRTYVPVRFAAQAFGCVVGWDQEAQTAIVIDTDKLVSAATEGKSFTYLEKLSAMDEKYNEGIWDMTATFDADVDLMGIPLTMSGTASGTVQDGNQASMDMNMKVGMASVALTAQGEMASGKLYLNMDLGALNTQAKVDPAAWYELDMTQLMEQAGMEWADVMTVSDGDMLDVLTVLFAGYQPYNAATSYTQVKAAADDLAVALSDQSFVLDSGAYVSTYALKTDDIDLNVNLALELDGETLKGYYLDFDYSGIVQGQTTKMGMYMSMNDKDEMTARVNMDMGELMTMDMTVEGAYAPGTTAPVTAPPAGAKVLPFTDLTGSAAQGG